MPADTLYPELLIFSELSDNTTSRIISWLNRYKVPCLRLNTEDTVGIIDLEISARQSSFLLEVCGHKVSLDRVKAYWYRRGGTSFSSFTQKIAEDIPWSKSLNEACRLELLSVEEFFKYYLNELPSLGTYRVRHIDKLKVLKEAALQGLSVPDMIVTSSKPTLEKFLRKHDRVITKPLGQTIRIKESDKKKLMFFTESVNDKVKHLPNTFFPSLFQEYIEKKFELRVFYLLGKFYTMAIFSQDSSRTSIDFRKYDLASPNRTVPFNLPKDITDKLENLMQKLSLNSGSIDLIVTPDNRFVFLEVNPTGQFHMVSHPCNYPIEKKIATHLKNLSQ